jgi:integrase
MRRGEILGLRWVDVELDVGSLSVCQSLEKTKSGIAVKSPKTAKGRRRIALPAMAVEALRRHKAQQGRAKLRSGGNYRDSGLVFSQDDGSPWDPDTISAAFGAFVRKAGFHIRFHDLRHTHATQLLRQGIHPKVVSERLGHSTISLTLDTYSHVMPGMQDEAARGVDSALRGALSATGGLQKVCGTRSEA